MKTSCADCGEPVAFYSTDYHRYLCIPCENAEWMTKNRPPCPGCGGNGYGVAWGPDGLCRDCYEDRIPSPYCKHGTYIGGPSGPDYICGPCEDGE